MIRVNWNPIAHLGPIPINWYGLGWAAAFRLADLFAPAVPIGAAIGRIGGRCF